MTLSPFLSDITLDTSLIRLAPSSPASATLALGSCHFDVNAYNDTAFHRYGISLPSRLTRAVPKRRSEFLAGRICARSVLACLTIGGNVESMDDNRAPRWPPLAVGAITHSHGIAASLAGPIRHWKGIGLDIEHWIPEEDARHLSSAILQPAEIKSMAKLDNLAFSRRLTLIFSAKETLFKALNPLTGASFYFHDATIVQITDDTLTLRLDKTLDTAWPAGLNLTCRYEQHSSYVMTWLCIPTSTF